MSSAKTARRRGFDRFRSRDRVARGLTRGGVARRSCAGWVDVLPEDGFDVRDSESFRMVLDQLPARAQNERRKNHCRATSSIQRLRRQGVGGREVQIAPTCASECNCKRRAKHCARNVQGSRESAYLDAGVVSPLDGAATGLRAPPQAFCSPADIFGLTALTVSCDDEDAVWPPEPTEESGSGNRRPSFKQAFSGPLRKILDIHL